MLSAFGRELGLDQKSALKIAEAFGGGMGNMGETCGAVIGAMMVIGLRYGRTEAGDEVSKEKVKKLTREFVKRFRKRHKTIICRELIGCDISTPVGKLRAEMQGAFDDCPEYVGTAVEILEEMR